MIVKTLEKENVYQRMGRERGESGKNRSDLKLTWRLVSKKEDQSQATEPNDSMELKK